jgi:uncharacterized damage-inducible protein DinB
MAETESQRLAELSKAVRESTLKRLRAVPAGHENWRIESEGMSFADIAQHLADADRWLFEKHKVKNLDPIQGRSNCVNIATRGQYEMLLMRLIECGRERALFLEKLTADKFGEKIHDSRFGGEVSVWWIIVRGNLDHEIHHRGQIAAMLRMLNSKKRG